MRVTLHALLCIVLLSASRTAISADAPPQSRLASHWSFIAPVKSEIPKLKYPALVRNPIDAFVAEEHEKRGLTSRPEADKVTLLRRVYLDVVGLAPTRDELHAFLADNSPDAYERVVDKLLASPQYGERWARHWMDVWRYSDWAGYQKEIRDSQPYMWRYRDWIVESLNSDKPYDRMVKEMLAGDELAPGDPQIVRATGFLARNYYKFNRNIWLENAVEHTSKAFLGLTMNCAKCHDHKYDPISQAEHYQFRAIFEAYNIRNDPVPGTVDVSKDGMVVTYDGDAAAKTFLFIRGNEMTPDSSNALAPAVPAFLGGKFEIHPIELPTAAWYPGSRASTQHDLMAADDAGIRQAEENLATAKKAVATAREAMRAAVAQTAAKSGAKDPTSELDETPVKPVIATPVGGATSEVAIPKLDLASGKAKSDSTHVELKTGEQEFAIAQREQTLSEYRLAVVKSQRRADVARIAADRARYASPAKSDAAALISAATQAEAEVKALQAEQDLFQAFSEAMAPKAPVTTGKTAAAPAKVKVVGKKPIDAAIALGVALDALDKPPATYAPLTPVYPTTSTGRRLALANWITARDNPLAARVAVNHIWMRHIGEPIVDSVFDFGKNGRTPTMPKLLDWMAVELMEHGWSMKHLHRLILTSSAYRMESSQITQDPNSKIDPDNKFVWRMNARRLEAEAVRDDLLLVSGQLDLTMGGPELEQDAGLTAFRRSLYFRNAYEKQMVFLKLFDGANPSECYRRMPTVMPQQALALANSPIAQSAARKLAATLTKEVGAGDAHDDAFIAAAFEQILTRQPAEAERSACKSFLSDQFRSLSQPKSLESFASGDSGALKPAADPVQRAREDLVHVLLNHSDFVTIR